MAYEGLIFALVTAVSFGIWTVFHQQASQHINPIFGAILVSLTAVILGSIILIPQIREITLFTNQKGIIFVILAGLAALALDFFALKTYATGISASVAGPIIIGGGIAMAAAIGILALGETVSLMKAVGIGFVILGAAILASL